MEEPKTNVVKPSCSKQLTWPGRGEWVAPEPPLAKRCLVLPVQLRFAVLAKQLLANPLLDIPLVRGGPNDRMSAVSLVVQRPIEKFGDDVRTADRQ